MSTPTTPTTPTSAVPAGLLTNGAEQVSPVVESTPVATATQKPAAAKEDVDMSEAHPEADGAPWTSSQQKIPTSSSRKTEAETLARLEENVREAELMAQEAVMMSRQQFEEAKARHQEWTERLDFFRAVQERRAKEQQPAPKPVVPGSHIVPSSLPVFKLKGDPTVSKWQPAYNTPEQFLADFEATLYAHGLAVEQHWRRLILLTHDATSRAALTNMLQGEQTWTQFREKFKKKHTSPFQVMYRQAEVLLKRKDPRTPLKKYLAEFQNQADEAGVSDDRAHAFLLVISLDKVCRDKAFAVIANRFGTDMPDTRSKMAEALLPLADGEDEFFDLADQEQTRNKRVHREPSPRRHHSPSAGPSGTSRFQAKRQRPDQRRRGQQHSAQEKRHINWCRYCRVLPYEHGHECPQMLEARRERKAMTARMATITSRTNGLNLHDDDLADLDRQAQGKQSDIKISSDIANKNSVMVPVTLQNKQVMALVDTGASTSFMDIEFATKNKFSVELYKSDVGDITLAEANTTIKRIGNVRQVQVLHNEIQTQHTFELMPLSNDTHIVIGLDLMPKIGIALTGLATSWTKLTKAEEDPVVPYEKPNESPAGTQEERDELMQAITPLLEQNAKIPKDSFCTIPESIVELKTPEGVTSYRRQYDLPIKSQEVVAQTIEKWLAEGTIEEAPINTSWNSPLTLAPKKDAFGNYTDKRPCLDPRHINQLLPDDRYPLPLIKDIFHQMGGAAIFTTLDLKSAFHRFQIHPDDRHKTSFTFNNRVYCFRGTPFGLKPISSKFQRVMNIVYRDMPFVTCFVDDVVVFSKNMREHIDHVAQAIRALTKVNLILNPDKCHFAQKSVYLLGFCVSATGRKLDTRKIANIHEWTYPTTGKDIQRFLGIVNYFREHIPKISYLTAPLDALRNAGSLKKLWTPRHDRAFESLIAALLNAPVLAFPREEHPFCVATDASNVGIGAVLYQVIDGQTFHIGFMARSLTKSERNYSVTRRELLAVVYALEKFHKYLWGQKFTLYTDHRALTYLHTQRIANAMMIKWLDTILDYDFDIVHLPGLDNILPDQLSRLFPEEKELEGGCEVRPVKKAKTSHTRSTVTNVMQRSTQIENPYREMLTPPTEERAKILLDAHLLGHFGADAMTQHLHSEGIHWTTINKDAAETVKKCIECQKFNIVRQGFNPLRPVHSFLPADHWAIDLAGPFRTTFLGNNYLLVMVDICTRFCILRPIPNKQSDTVVKALIQVFCDFGFPRYLQSDNGTEFRNSMVKLLAETTGFDHRLTTPYHPRANGVAERWVQSSVRTLKKFIRGAIKDWDLFVPAVQLSLNAKVSKRHNTAPYTLMFARKINGFKDYTEDHQLTPESEKELIDRITKMQDVVFPAIKERTMAVIKAQQNKFDKKHIQVDFPAGSQVMAKTTESVGKLDPIYDGPYTVVRKNQGGAYVLKDEKNDILTREYAPSQLKLISQDEVIPCDELYEVEAIIAHNEISPGNYEYKIRWKGYSEDHDTWELADAFTQRHTISDYWKKIGQEPNQKEVMVPRNVIPVQTPKTIAKKNVSTKITKKNTQSQSNRNAKGSRSTVATRSSKRISARR